MLTDIAIKRLKPKDKSYKVADRDGMYVAVLPSGAISFRYDYRLNGRRETLTLGAYGPGGLTLAEARDVFEVRRALEAEVVRLVVKRWKPSFGAELEGLVREEEAARERHEEHVWGRLAGEFHIRLAKLSGNALLEKYMAELVTRCSLILAVFGKPHSHDGHANEHAEIIAALRSRDAARAVELMDHHMGVVESRAIVGPEEETRPAIGDVLARYAGAITARETATPLVRKARTK